MNTLKKITYLLIITAFITGNIKAQQTVKTNAKIIITNFKVYENNTQLTIDWSANGTVDANYWQVQSSTDGKQYNTIALVFGPDPRQEGNRYQYKGKIKYEATGSKTYYKVCPIDIKGKEISSEIIPSAK